jgi:hypothetical protein
VSSKVKNIDQRQLISLGFLPVASNWKMHSTYVRIYVETIFERRSLIARETERKGREKVNGVHEKGKKRNQYGYTDA